MKRLIVSGLEKACSALDNIPRIYRYDNRWHYTRGGCWGCSIGLANASAKLDEKWQTGVWK